MHLTVLRTMESGAFGEPFALFKQVLEPKRPASDVFVSLLYKPRLVILKILYYSIIGLLPCFHHF